MFIAIKNVYFFMDFCLVDELFSDDEAFTESEFFPIVFEYNYPEI